MSVCVMAKLFSSLNESKKSQILRSNQPSDLDNEFRTNPHSFAYTSLCLDCAEYATKLSLALINEDVGYF